jgi:hypothetical protein
VVCERTRDYTTEHGHAGERVPRCHERRATKMTPAGARAASRGAGRAERTIRGGGEVCTTFMLNYRPDTRHTPHGRTHSTSRANRRDDIRDGAALCNAVLHGMDNNATL